MASLSIIYLPPNKLRFKVTSLGAGLSNGYHVDSPKPHDTPAAQVPGFPNIAHHGSPPLSQCRTYAALLSAMIGVLKHAPGAAKNVARSPECCTRALKNQHGGTSYNSTQPSHALVASHKGGNGCRYSDPLTPSDFIATYEAHIRGKSEVLQIHCPYA